MICYQFQITAFKLNQRNGVTVQKTTMKEMSCKRLPEINFSAKNDFLTQGWSFFFTKLSSCEGKTIASFIEYNGTVC